MRTLLSALILGVLILTGCGESTSSGVGSTYLQSDVAIVKYVNDSQRANTYVEVETELGNLLLLTTSTQVFLQTADFAGFDNSSVAPDIRNGIIIHPGQTVEYYYEMGNVNYAAPKTEYTVSKIYVYLLGCPNPPAVTED